MQNTEHKAVDRVVRVAVGVVRDGHGRVLIAKRPSHKHQGGLWEFPGGKIEAGETCEQALSRELAEEVGLRLIKSVPLLKISHSYPDKKVLLEVRDVTAFNGIPVGREGQEVLWMETTRLRSIEFPAANQPILKALCLPDLVAITGDFKDLADFAARIERALSRGAGMVQVRLPPAAIESQRFLLQVAQDICRGRAIVTVNSAVERAAWAELPGLHLRAFDLMAIEARPAGVFQWLGASCHCEAEVRKAVRIGADYVFISPVMPTVSHPEVRGMGWKDFTCLASQASVPVYALGGLVRSDFALAQEHSARGIAGITMFWN